MKKRKIKTFDIVNYIMILILVIIMLYPIVHVIAVSVSDFTEVSKGHIGLVPRGFDLTGYKIILGIDDLKTAYRNTIIYTVLGMMCGVIFTCLAAYPLAQKKLFGRKMFNFLLIIPMMITAGIIPNFLVVNQIGLIDTIWPIILIPAFNSFNIILMRISFEGVPKSISESAFIDGASDWTILFKIMIPLCKSVIVVIALFIGIYQWNNYINPLIYLNSNTMKPLSIFLKKVLVEGIILEGSVFDFIRELGENIGGVPLEEAPGLAEKLQSAAVIVAIGPILLLYPFLQRYFEKGIMLGAVKE